MVAVAGGGGRLARRVGVVLYVAVVAMVTIVVVVVARVERNHLRSVAPAVHLWK